MQLSRSEKREEKYLALMKQGQDRTHDYLYLSEIKKLEKTGYIINQLSTHPFRKYLLFCEVIFPPSEDIYPIRMHKKT